MCTGNGCLVLRCCCCFCCLDDRNALLVLEFGVHVVVAIDMDDNVFVDDDPDSDVADDVDAVRSSPSPPSQQSSSLQVLPLLLGLIVLLNDVLLSRRLTFSRSNRCDGNNIIA